MKALLLLSLIAVYVDCSVGAGDQKQDEFTIMPPNNSSYYEYTIMPGKGGRAAYHDDYCTRVTEEEEEQASSCSAAAEEDEEKKQKNETTNSDSNNNKKQQSRNLKRIAYKDGGLLVENTKTKMKTTIGVRQKVKPWYKENNKEYFDDKFDKLVRGIAPRKKDGKQDETMVQDFYEQLSNFEESMVNTYLHDMILGNTKYSCMYNKCENRDELCVVKANSGECVTNRLYMIDEGNCLLACKSCEGICSKSSSSTLLDDDKGKDSNKKKNNSLKGKSRAELEKISYEDGGLLVTNVETNRKSTIGVPQVKTPPADEVGNKKQAIVEKMQKVQNKMVKYLEKIILKDTNKYLVYGKCKNHHEKCTYWAAIGECKANPAFMIDEGNCVLACRQCKKICSLPPGMVVK